MKKDFLFHGTRRAGALLALPALLAWLPAGAVAQSSGGRGTGNDTAYQALRALGAQRAKALPQVVELRGRGGAPQPGSWKFFLSDPSARGGVREVELARGKVVSERTPLRTATAADMTRGHSINLARLNMDSDGAFLVAEEEARAARLGFYGADFVLRSARDEPGRPLWVVTLLDARQKSLGSVTVAADSGAVLGKTFGDKKAHGGWAAGGGLKGRLQRFSSSVGRSFQSAGAKLQEFWSGDGSAQPPPPSPVKPFKP